MEEEEADIEEDGEDDGGEGTVAQGGKAVSGGDTGGVAEDEEGDGSGGDSDGEVAGVDADIVPYRDAEAS